MLEKAVKNSDAWPLGMPALCHSTTMKKRKVPNTNPYSLASDFSEIGVPLGTRGFSGASPFKVA